MAEEQRFRLARQLEFQTGQGLVAVVNSRTGNGQTLDDDLLAMLAALSGNEGKTASEIAEALGAEPEDVAEYLAALMGAGLVVEDEGEPPLIEDMWDGHGLLRSLVGLGDALSQELLGVGPASSRWLRDELGATWVSELRLVVARLVRVQAVLDRRQPSYVRDKVERASAKASRKRLHLGCGPDELEGWYNIDLWPASVPLYLGRPLPFESGTIECVYFAHALAHFFPNVEGARVLAEIYRVLQPGGTLRVAVPDAKKYLEAYAAEDESFFSEQRRQFFWWAAGARTKLEAIAPELGIRTHHTTELERNRYSYDCETLRVHLEAVGFTDVSESSFNASANPELRVDDNSYLGRAQVDGAHFSLFVEARKPPG